MKCVLKSFEVKKVSKIYQDETFNVARSKLSIYETLAPIFRPV